MFCFSTSVCYKPFLEFPHIMKQLNCTAAQKNLDRTKDSSLHPRFSGNSGRHNHKSFLWNLFPDQQADRTH